MFCPFCTFKDTKVVDSRFSGSMVRRRRECEGCERRFSTVEKPLLALTVIKRDGTREPFSREKVRSGIVNSSRKTGLTEEDAERIMEYIEKKVTAGDSMEVRSSLIGRLVMKELRKRDKVAYLRFASVYKKFDDLSHFEKELKTLR